MLLNRNVWNSVSCQFRNFKTLFPGRRTEGRDDHGWSVVRGPANLKMELSYFFGSWSHANNSLLKKGSVSAIHDCNLFCSWKIELLSCLSSTARWITKVTETYPGETQAQNGQGGTWNSQGSSIECWRSDIQISNFQVMRSLSWCDWAPGENQFLIKAYIETPEMCTGARHGKLKGTVFLSPDTPRNSTQ